MNNFLLLLLILLKLIVVTAYIRQKTPYFRSYTPNYLFGETFIENLGTPYLNLLTATYRIAHRDYSDTCCKRELSLDQNWCKNPPCYDLSLNPCRTFSEFLVGYGKVCKVGEAGMGYCIDKADYKNRVFPGDLCNDSSECQYGARECKKLASSSQKKCAHLDSAMRCKSTSDCEPGYYCSNIDGIKQCMKTSDIGNGCRDDEVCAGNALCHFEQINDLNGKCIEFFSLKNGKDVRITLKIKGVNITSIY